MQVELIEQDISRADSPKPSHSHSHSGSQTAASQAAEHSMPQTPRGSSPRASESQMSNYFPSGASDAGTSEHADDAAVTELTTRSSGTQHGMQLPPVKAQKGSNTKGNTNGKGSGESGLGRRRGSGRGAGRQTSEELPDVTGRQSDHTAYDASGIRRVSTAGRRMF